ncbi:hypothetical protein RDI58_024296 [Solanum bulbocastanum]|uniref:Uncharacterized protein n=1 Tax=Solanum bulbocastanum TaxID=147425 RepID=A0AAN8T4N5_SOLBU
MPTDCDFYCYLVPSKKLINEVDDIKNQVLTLEKEQMGLKLEDPIAAPTKEKVCSEELEKNWVLKKKLGHIKEESHSQKMKIRIPSDEEMSQVFTSAAGLHLNLVQIHEVIKAWWDADFSLKLKPLFKVVPTLIAWEQWNRRNTQKYGGRVSFNRVVHQINNNLFYLAKVSYHGCIRSHIYGLI